MRSLCFLFLLLTCSVELYSQNADSNCACCTEKHAEFDFWIGTWTVTKPDGTPAGKNTITKIEGQCALKEQWTSAQPGYTGTSYNFYNSTTQQWEQLWLDNQGGFLKLKGQRVKNKMILKTETQSNADGVPFYHRVTWTYNDDGTVRQYWETITNGFEITVAFDGLYKKTE